MILKEKHRKHGKLKRPQLGRFGRFEICLVGTNCGRIAQFVDEFRQYCPDGLSVAYVDASHNPSAGTDDFFPKASLHQNTFKSQDHYENEWDLRHAYLDKDIVFVNGNHFEAGNQVVFVDSEKENSLGKRMSWINDIKSVVYVDSATKTFSFLKDVIDADTPEYSIQENEKTFQYILGLYQKSIPPLKGLVLGGGKSQRMGMDKSQLDYHGMPQEKHLYRMMEDLGLPTYLSKREAVEDNSMQYIPDRLTHMGPFGALISAFMEDPDAAWLTIACDLPYIGEQHLQKLIQQRNPAKIATCYRSEKKEFPEPLITIWEPKSYSMLLKFLAQGISCPRKVLINSEVLEIVVKEDRFLENVNTPDEYHQAIESLTNKNS